MNDHYKLLDELNLCHRCQKAICAPNRKYCPKCLEKMAQYNADHYDAAKAHLYQKRRKELYYQKKEQGICVRCTKKATHGLYCYEHSINAKRRSKKTDERRKRERHERGLIPEIREKNNLCLRCGNPLDLNGYKLCSKCIEENKKNSKKANKEFYRKLEKSRLEKECYSRMNRRLKK